MPNSKENRKGAISVGNKIYKVSFNPVNNAAFKYVQLMVNMKYAKNSWSSHEIPVWVIISQDTPETFENIFHNVPESLQAELSEVGFKVSQSFVADKSLPVEAQEWLDNLNKEIQEVLQTLKSQ